MPRIASVTFSRFAAAGLVPAPRSGSARARRRKISLWPNHGLPVRFTIARGQRVQVLARPIGEPDHHVLPGRRPGDLQQFRHRPVPAVADQRQSCSPGMSYSLNVSASSLSSPLAVESSSTKSGCAAAHRLHQGGRVRSAAGCRSRRPPRSASRPSARARVIGFMKLTDAAVLSPIDRDLGRPLAGGLLRQLHHRRHRSGRPAASAVGEDWNTYLKPRSVIRSE